MSKGKVTTVLPALKEYLVSVGKAGIAFSGGVDSCYLLYAAVDSGIDVTAYYVQSQFQPQFELADAKRLAAQLAVEMKVIPLDVLADPMVSSNPADRCYHCKRAIFAAIQEQAAADGYHILMDGSNASDDAGDRPGMRVLSELKVRSPLRETGMTKAKIREMSRAAGLFSWDKPAYACLATRVPTGTQLEPEILVRIENAETALSQMGFTDFRARVWGDAARLQLPATQLAEAAKRHEEIRETLKPWFTEVLLDLQPR